MSVRKTALLIALLLVPTILATAPTAGARHICLPDEPPFSCEHRAPSGEDVAWACRLVFSDRICDLIDVNALS